MYQLILKIRTALLCALVLVVPNATAEKLTYFTEDFPPYNFADDKGAIAGISAEYVRAMFKEMGTSMEQEKVQLVPWARGYSAAQAKDKQVALFSTTRTAARENLFKWAGPIAASTHALIVVKGNPKGVEIPSSKVYDTKVRYGSIRDDINLITLQKNGVPDDKIEALAKFEQLYKMLEKGRIDVISYNPDVALWKWNKSGIDTSNFEVIHEKVLGEMYIAFNLAVSDEVVKAHQDALDKVKADPNFDKMVKAKFR